jgi:class 3 adenylate cyclase/tetratricopeptide (TPR) repeat protein
MSFLETVERARAFLERNGRVSRRALQREFDLDDSALDELIEELVEIQRVGVREGGALAWAGAVPPARTETLERERVPRDYTPKHLVDKILTFRSALEGERKQVTVLFADVEGSMDLQESIDLEQWHQIVDRFFQILADGVHRFEGTINQYTGDGIMALFGAPIAHEDHAQRACYSALYLRQNLQRYAQELKREQELSFPVRMGLNSGTVIVGKIGDDLRMDYTAQGHTVGLAARMEKLADSGKVYMAEPTARRVEGFVRSEDLGEFNIAGASEPIRVFELMGAGPLRTRFDLSRARGLSRFVGRADEMATLEAGLEQARTGEGGVIGVVAEAGTGKSRLCFEFLEHARARGFPVHEARGVAHSKMIPYLPVLELFRSFFSIAEEDSAETARDKIAARLVRVDPALTDSLPVIFDFLGVPDPERPAPQIDPEKRQRRLFGIAKRLIQTLGGADPAVVLIEDLQWIDGGSEGFFEQMVDVVGESRVLLLVNFRPGYHADWMQRSRYQRLPLPTLRTEAVRDLLADLLGGDPSVESLQDAIYKRTRGNPFFIEEVVQSLVESGSLEGTPGRYLLIAPLAQLGVPDTVQAVLAARIDRLPDREKQVLETAAVIGKQFERRLLREVVDLADAELDAALAALGSAGFVYEHALFPELEYTFKHPLTQEVAYASQLGERRARLHGTVARAIEEIHGDQPSAAAARISHHWEGAGEPFDAARWSHQAAVWVGFSDPAEAMRHWRKVRELASKAGDTEQARRLGVAACVWILRFSWRIGWDLDEMASAFREGRDFAENMDDARSVAQLCSAYGGSKAVALEPAKEALGLIDEAREIAGEIDDPAFTLRLVADWAVAYGHVGQPDESRRVNEELVEQMRSDPRLSSTIHRSRAYMFLLCSGSFSLLRQGRLAEAARMAEEAHRLARARNAVEVVGWAVATLARCHAAFGDPEGALRAAREAVEAAERLGGYMRGASYHALAEAHAAAGEWSRAREAAELALSIDERGSWYATSLNTLTEICIETGDYRRATELVEEARALGLPAGQGTEPDARFAHARLLLRVEGLAAADRVEAMLAELRDTCDTLGARLLLPRIDLESAEIARLRGDAPARELALRTAQRSFTEIGATARAERMAEEHRL